MGLLERVAAARSPAHRKSWSEPPIWDAERFRYGLYGMPSSPAYSDRELIESDFQGYVEGIYKRNGAVAALLFVRQMVFSEARFQYRRMNNGRPGDLFGTADLALLEEPWPNATTGDLLTRMIGDADLAGNAYFTVVGEGANRRIRRLRPDWVTIVSGSRSEPSLYGAALDAELLGYIYSPRTPGAGTTEGTILTPDQVAHFAPIPDPIANWRGMSWLTPVLREVSADSAATLHKLKFFENGASLQVVVSVDAAVKKPDFDRFVAAMEEQHKGADNAYRTLYLGGGADATVVGADMKQLDFKATQGAGESRLAAAAGVPSVIVGFSEGLQGSSLNAGNYASSRRRFADGTLRPLWRNAAGSLATLVSVQGGAALWYDDRDIAFLREDRKDAAEIQGAQAQTIRTLVDAGYEPASVVAAVEAEDYRLLKHTGYYSVQLQELGAGTAPNANPAPPPALPTPPAGGQ
jgi:phage portal protein BeeE